MTGRISAVPSDSTVNPPVRRLMRTPTIPGSIVRSGGRFTAAMVAPTRTSSASTRRPRGLPKISMIPRVMAAQAARSRTPERTSKGRRRFMARLLVGGRPGVAPPPCRAQGRAISPFSGARSGAPRWNEYALCRARLGDQGGEGLRQLLVARARELPDHDAVPHEDQAGPELHPERAPELPPGP